MIIPLLVAGFETNILWSFIMYIVYPQVTLYCLAAASLSLGGETMPWVLWTGTAILGVSLAPIFPTLLTWTNEHFEVSELVIRK